MMKKNNIKTPLNMNSWWNFGSLISMYMIIQFIMGFMLSMNYLINNNKFNNSMFIYLNLNFGWMFRLFHSNLTSLIFILMMIHILRNFMFSSFINKLMWISGMIMMLIYMLISFLGYTLTWTQMSYWGMMVITNFISIIPIFGKKIMFWIWGNFKINIILINRFFSIHFILPIFIFIIIIIHLNIIHNFKSNNPLGLNNKIDFLNLIPNSIYKDFLLMIIFFFFLLNLILFNPFYFYENDNFNQMNYFKTPNHIKPEWYFLFFYSILRSIENKFSGLMLMILSLLMFMFFSILKYIKIMNIYFKYLYNMKMIMFIFIIYFISLLGSKNIEFPYSLINKILIYFYFLNFIL